jgi:hypothetical protein
MFFFFLKPIPMHGKYAYIMLDMQKNFPRNAIQVPHWVARQAAAWAIWFHIV